MIERRIWTVLYSILILGFLYIGAHLVIHLTKESNPVYEELAQELENPTPRAEYMTKYKKFLKEKESPPAEDAGNNNTLSIPSSFQTASSGLSQNKKLVMK